MYNKNKKANVFIYTIILTLLGVSFGIIVMNNSATLLLVKKNSDIKNKLIKNIDNKAKIIDEFLLKTNSDGSGFIDKIACPKDFTMSGSSNKETDIDSQLKYSNSLDTKFYCNGRFNGYNINFYFKEDYSDFEKAEYKSKELSINSGTLDGNFSDSDNTYLDLETTNNYYYSDNIDDNFNSDNYSGNSTGDIDYPDNFQDNDNYIKKNIIGTIYPKKTQNIFWNNSKIEKIINKNINNTGSLNIKLGEVEEGNLYLDIDNDLILKLIKFDKNKFDNFNEIKKQEFLTGTISGSGYIKNNGGTLELNQTIDSDTYDFDFKNNGYILFLENNSENYINFYLSGKDNSGSGIILNPIDDSLNNSYLYLGYSVLEGENGNFYKLMKKIIGKK